MAPWQIHNYDNLLRMGYFPYRAHWSLISRQQITTITITTEINSKQKLDFIEILTGCSVRAIILESINKKECEQKRVTNDSSEHRSRKLDRCAENQDWNMCYGKENYLKGMNHYNFIVIRDPRSAINVPPGLRRPTFRFVVSLW